jgi:ribosomal protein S18 acetylase RimI-like enzyme
MEPAAEKVATRTYLEMRDRSALRPAKPPEVECEVARIEKPDPALWRWLYSEVGREYHWVDRLEWTDDEARAYLDDPNVSLWVLTAGGRTAGYFELHREADSAVEIAYFGILPEFTGGGLGGHMLTEAVRRTWDAGATRIWLHTSSLDHPAAIANYLNRGFTIFKTEEYRVRLSVNRLQ